jgi:REP element-mobilizing transposase RayT
VEKAPLTAIPPARNRDREGALASAYLITFVCYGSWLPGQSGAVDRDHNLFGGRWNEADVAKETRAKSRMKQNTYLLDANRREIVLTTLQEVCSHRQWTLLAAHVRSNHVHAVVAADDSPERVMSAFKAYASRTLNRLVPDRPDRRRWARHGSTRYLWNSQMISAAIRYVVCEQGEPMALFEAPVTPPGAFADHTEPRP